MSIAKMYLLTTIMLLTLLFGNASVLALAAEDTWKQVMDSAETAYIDGEYKQAEFKFQSALKLARELKPEDNRLAQTLFKLGLASEKSHQYKTASALYIESLRIEESAPEPRFDSAATTRNHLIKLCLSENDAKSLAKPLTDSYVRQWQKETNTGLPGIKRSPSEDTIRLRARILDLFEREKLYTQESNFLRQLIAVDDPQVWNSPKADVWTFRRQLAAASMRAGCYAEGENQLRLLLMHEQAKITDLHSTAEIESALLLKNCYLAQKKTDKAKSASDTTKLLIDSCGGREILMPIYTKVREVRDAYQRNDFESVAKLSLEAEPVLAAHDLKQSPALRPFYGEFCEYQNYSLNGESMTSAESRKLVHEFSPEYNAHELFHLDFTKELGRVVDLSKRRDPFDSREALDRASKYIEAHTFVPTLCHVWLYIREAELAQKNGDDALSIQFFRRAAKLDSEGIACQAWSADAGSNGEQLYGPYAELAKKHKLSELPMIQAKLDSFRKNQNHGCLALP